MFFETSSACLYDNQLFSHLDQIRFDNPEDREIIHSEISALQMTNDEEMEMAILGKDWYEISLHEIVY